MKLARWGNSLAIRIPAVVVEILDLKEGDDIEIVAAGEELKVARTPPSAELLERLRRLRGKMPPDWKFDRDWSNSR